MMKKFLSLLAFVFFSFSAHAQVPGGQPEFCVTSASQTPNYNQLCMSVTGTGGTIGLTNFGSATGGLTVSGVNNLLATQNTWLALQTFNLGANFLVSPTAPTQLNSDNSTKLATTSYVHQYLSVPITGTPSTGWVPVAASGAAAAWAVPPGNVVIGAPITGTPCSNGQGLYDNSGTIGCTSFSGGGGFTVGATITGSCTSGFVVYNNAGNIGCENLAGGGNVITSGTPTSQQLPIWVDATHLGNVPNPNAVPLCSASNPTDTLPTTPFSYALSVSGLAVTTYPLNTIAPTFFLNAADSVVSNTFWTTGAVKYLVSQTAGNILLQTLYCSRDQEVTSWTQDGIAYLRYANGNAIFFNHNRNAGGGQLTIGIVTGLIPGTFGSGTKYTFYTNSSLTATLGTAYSHADTTGDTFTFGVSGFNVYVKFGGTQFINITMGPWALEQNGAIALTSVDNSATGWRDVTVNHLATQSLYSDVTNQIFDVRDFGARETLPSAVFTGSIATTTLTVSSVTSGKLYPGMIIRSAPGATGGVIGQTFFAEGTQIVNQLTGTTGSTGTYTVSISQAMGSQVVLGFYGVATGTISQSSNSLVLNQPTNLRVGDWITVQCGTETGACMRGTVGVGGQWPSLNYATTATLQADTSKAANTYAYATDTGNAWQYVGFTASISGTTLTVTASPTSANKLAIGDIIFGAGIAASTTITGFGTGVGGNGTYTVNNSQTVGSEAMTTWTPPSVFVYYAAMAIPQSLQAQVTVISGDGLTLTLSQAAQAAATNAAVYLDNAPFVNFLSYTQQSQFPGFDFTSITPRGATINIPEGMFSVGGEIILQNQVGWTISGQGRYASTLFAPNAIHGPSVVGSGSPYTTVQDLAILSNNGQLNYYGLSVNQSYNNLPTTIVPNAYNVDGTTAWTFTRFVAQLTQVSIPQSLGIGVGVDLENNSDNSIIRNVMVTNHFTDAIATAKCYNCWAYDVLVNWTANLQSYTQWQIEWSTSVGGGCTRCTINATYVVAGIEMFGSEGVQYNNITLNNATVSVNGSSNFALNDFNVTLNSTYSPSFSPIGTAIFLINSNLGAGGSGQIKNAIMTQTGYRNASNDLLPGINIATNTNAVSVIGGAYLAPNWLTPSVHGPVGILTVGNNVTIDGFVVTGTPLAGQHQIWMISPGTGVISNSVAADVFCDPTVQCQLSLIGSMGTFAPTLLGSAGAGAPSYTTQLGNYTISYSQNGTAILRKIDVDFNILTTGLGGPTGNMQVGSLPFTSVNTAGIIGNCFLSQYSGWTADAGYSSIGGTIQPNSTVVSIIESGSGQIAAATPVSNYAAATNLMGTCTYH